MLPRFMLVAAFAALAPASAFGASPARDNIDALIELHAKAQKVPTEFVHRVVKRESNYNPRAKGGSALGLMQIKHATARGVGYKGDADGLYDPETNLRFGIAYFAQAYRLAKGDYDQAYRYYNRGFYYAAKRLGITTEMPDDVAAAPATPAATTATGFAGLFGQRAPAATVQTASADLDAPLAYAPLAAAGTVEVPLPPRRPEALGRANEAAPIAAGALSAQPPSAPAGGQAAVADAAQTVEVPLPPRRPSAAKLAALVRPAAAKADPARVEEAASFAPAR